MPYANPAIQRQYQREWKNRRRDDWLRQNGPCAGCGSWADLQVDHVNRSQKVDHRLWSWSDARRIEELAKCQALCVPYHIAKGDGIHRGEDHGRSKFLAIDVERLRALVESGLSCAEAGRRLGVDRKTAWDMVHRTWKHLDGL